MSLYAAYASNLDPAHMAQHCPHSPLRSTGWLPGWRLTFGGEDLSEQGALATIVEDPASQVFVALYDVAEQDEPALDAWETPAYTRLKVRVHTLEGEELAWLYVLNSYEGGRPSALYLGLLADAAEIAGAPPDYVTDLRSRPCL